MVLPGCHTIPCCWLSLYVWDWALRHCSNGNSTSSLGRYSSLSGKLILNSTRNFLSKKCWEIWSSEANTFLVGVQVQGQYLAVSFLCAVLYSEVGAMWLGATFPPIIYTQSSATASEWGIYTMGSLCCINNCSTESTACLTVTTLFIQIWQCNYSCGRWFKYRWWSKYALRKI